MAQLFLGEDGRAAVLGGVESVFGQDAGYALAALAKMLNGPLVERVDTFDAAGTAFGTEPRATGGALIILAFSAARRFFGR